MAATSVRDSKYDAIIANTTASASGVKIYFAAPDNNVTGTNTMQMHNVDTSAGAATCCALFKIAAAKGILLAPRFRCVFSISTVASSTSMPTASAKPPSDITLIVSPSWEKTATEKSMASGIEVHTINVLRQLPRKIRIMMAVSKAAVIASCTTSRTEAFTSSD